QNGWLDTPVIHDANLVICFVNDKWIEQLDTHFICKQQYPTADIMLIGSGGQIIEQNLYDDEMCIIAIKWNAVKNKGYKVDCDTFDKSFDAGANLAKNLIQDDLKHILIFADAQHVNGEQMIDGMYSVLPKSVSVSGGFASDNASFKRGMNGLNANPTGQSIIGMGLYGKTLRVYCAAESGWQTFGPKRLVTKAKGNRLIEVDGQNILDLYGKYVQLEDKNTAALHALYHPIAAFSNNALEFKALRAILGIDEEEKSLIMAANVTEGSKIQLSHGHYQSLIKGAEAAATILKVANRPDAFVLVVVCIARRVLLGNRTEDELDVVKEILDKVPCIGCYSHGEIAYDDIAKICEQHNQTMTMTAFYEELDA
ncbi:MAG: FIST signal transduction protein, partial [Alphaproteobacteria bacterium]